MDNHHRLCWGWEDQRDGLLRRNRKDHGRATTVEKLDIFNAIVQSPRKMKSQGRIHSTKLKQLRNNQMLAMLMSLQHHMEPVVTVHTLIDSGASSYMTNQQEYLEQYEEFQQPEKVGLGDGRTVLALGSGYVQVNMRCGLGGKLRRAVIHNVLFVPKLTCNLFSVRAAAAKGNKVKFGEKKCWIRNSIGRLCGMGSLVEKLYQLDCELTSTIQASVAAEAKEGLDLWHRRLGHLNEQQIKTIIQENLAKGPINIPKSGSLLFCESCVEGKMQRKSFKALGEIRSSRRLELVYMQRCLWSNEYRINWW